jgi:hypothetical protein
LTRQKIIPGEILEANLAAAAIILFHSWNLPAARQWREHHTNQACCKSAIICPEHHGRTPVLHEVTSCEFLIPRHILDGTQEPLTIS